MLTRTPAVKHALSVAALTLVLGTTLMSVGGCVVVVGDRYSSASATARLTKTVSVPYEADAPIKAATENGSINIERTATIQDIVITAEIKARSISRAEAVQVQAVRLTDRTLDIKVIWPDGRKSNEGASLTVQSPGSRNISIETTNGAIITSGFAGQLNANTSNGSINIKDHDGNVWARTSNGSVSLDRVAGADVDTSNGSVDIILTSNATGPLQVETSNGAITVGLGGYRGTLAADTSNGRIVIDAPHGGISVTQQDKHHTKMIVGEAGSVGVVRAQDNSTVIPVRDGRISTSNGGVRIYTN